MQQRLVPDFAARDVRLVGLEQGALLNHLHVILDAPCHDEVACPGSVATAAALDALTLRLRAIFLFYYLCCIWSSSALYTLSVLFHIPF